MSKFPNDVKEKSLQNLITYLESVYKLIDENKNKAELDKIITANNKIIIKLNTLSPEKIHDANEIQIEIENLIRIIKTPEEELAIRKEIFDDYAILSDYIQMANLNIQDIYAIIAFFIKRNIRSCITEDAITIDMNVLKNLKFETMDINYLLKRIMDGEINDLINSDGDELTELEQKQVEELNRRLPEFTRSLKSVRKYTMDFEKYILDKMPNILLDDILEAKIALRGLHCSEYIIDKIVIYLLNTYEKNLKNQKNPIDVDLTDVYINILFPITTDENGEYLKDEMYYKNNYHKNLIRNHNKSLTVKKKPQEVKVATKKYLTEDDVRALNKCIRKFFNLHDVKIIAIPNYEELINVIDSMEKLELEPLEIRRFLSTLLKYPKLPTDLIKTESELLNVVNKLIKFKVEGQTISDFIRKYRSNFRVTYDDAIKEYLSRIDEIKFYDESIEKDMADLYSESLSSSPEDYKLIVSMIQEYLDMLSKYNLSVDYEYSLAKNLK